MEGLEFAANYLKFPIQKQGMELVILYTHDYHF